MEKVKGIVKSVNNKGKNYGINIDDVWYNGFNDSPVNKGDNVEVDFEINGQWKNVSKITLLNEAPKEEQNNKTVSMYVSYAKDIFIAGTEKADGVLNIDEAKKMMEASTDLIKQARNAFENEKPEIPTESETQNKEM